MASNRELCRIVTTPVLSRKMSKPKYDPPLSESVRSWRKVSKLYRQGMLRKMGIGALDKRPLPRSSFRYYS